MRKTIAVISAALLLSFTASAQWYLFPGSKSGKPVRDTVKVKPDTLTARPDTLIIDADTLLTAAVDTFVLDIPEIINLSLLLPIKSETQKPSANFLEYYCGALMAVRDLGLQGVRINLSVFDTGSGLGGITPETLSRSDVIIGPVSSSDITSLHEMLPEDKYIISPIEPKAAALVDSMRVIQAPVPWKEQTDRLIEWAASETGFRDKVILLKDNSEETPGEQTEYLIKKLDESGIKYSTVHSTTLHGMELSGTVRFFIASDRDIFLCSAINNIANIVSRDNKIDAVLYSTSRIRSLEGMNAVSPHMASARITSAYNIDYEDTAVQDFVRSYRALYHNEPASFAFSGYDTVMYFTRMCAQYGRQWPRKLAEYAGSGLQTDFRFDSCESTGTVNTAVRRILYNPDLSMQVLK